MGLEVVLSHCLDGWILVFSSNQRGWLYYTHVSHYV